VLYELLVGEPPFTGATSHAVISKALTEDLNPPSQYRKSVPRHVDAVAAKALEKLPADRFGSTGEMARALGDESFRHGRGEEDVVSKALSKALRGWKIGTLMTGAVAITSIWLLFSGVLSRSDDPPPTSRQQLNLPRAGFSYPWPGVLAVAPDGSSMIYDDSVATGEGYSQFYLKPRDAPQGTPIPGTVNGWIPVYSHDSRWIAYGVDSILMKRPVEGGAPITVAEDAAPQLGGVAWMEDGSILYARRSGVLARVREGGEESPEALADFSPQRITFLHSLPGDRGVLVSLCSWPGCETATVAVYSMQADTAWVVAENGVRAWYVPTGHLVYVDKAGVVLAVPFDLDRLEVGVGVEPLFEGVRVFASAGRAEMVVGRDGTVVYVERPPDDPQTEVVWVDRRGQVEDLDPEWVGDLREPALSPDHRRIALNVGEQVWVVDLPSGQRHPLTAAAEASWRAAWSPDGSRIAFLHGYGFGDSTRIAEVSSAGVSLNDFEILLGPRFFVRVTYAPPAAGIVFGEQVFLPEENSNDMNIGFLRSADVQPEALLATRFSESSAAVSPDGLWIAYVSDRTGESEIWVSPFSEVDQIPQRVSTDGGWEPVWAHNGRELFFRDGEGYLVAAEYSADPWFTVLAMDRLFDAEPYLRAPFASGYDVDEADERFLMIRPAGSRDPNAGERMILIRHWFTELQERLGTGGRGW
jgi:serine/threonine-protein kinase